VQASVVSHCIAYAQTRPGQLTDCNRRCAQSWNSRDQHLEPIYMSVDDTCLYAIYALNSLTVCCDLSYPDTQHKQYINMMLAGPRTCGCQKMSYFPFEGRDEWVVVPPSPQRAGFLQFPADGNCKLFGRKLLESVLPQTITRTHWLAGHGRL
jgi:hypothetical protein